MQIKFEPEPDVTVLEVCEILKLIWAHLSVYTDCPQEVWEALPSSARRHFRWKE
jgi:hypothetical protein